LIQQKKLAIGLTRSGSIHWWSSGEDISGIPNCTDSSTVKTTCGANGKSNSAALVSAGYTNASYGAGYCYNQTTGGFAKGSWFLPSIQELNTIYNKKSTLSSAISSVGGTDFDTLNNWSSTEYSGEVAWIYYLSKGSVVSYYNKYHHLNVTRCAIQY